MTTVRSSGNAFKVNTGGTVTITDVTVNHTAENTSYFVQNSGSFTMTGGSFTAVAKTGTGYMFYSNGTLTIERTPITTTVEGSAKTRVFHAYGNASDTNKMTVKNSTISMMVGGTGIYFYRADGTPAVEFDTCTITGQDTVKVDYLFYNNGSGTLTFNGGTVQSGDGAKYATLIYNNGTSTLNLTNTTVSNKTSEAGSVILNRNTLNITGGEVKVETHSSSTKDIYAIQSTKGVVKIDGASITVNAPDFVSNGKQAAIYIKNDNGSVDSDVTLKDTTISVTSKRDKEAYGILLEGGRIESITGGSITMTYEASYSRHKGYGIYQNGAASSIGTISGTTIAASSMATCARLWRWQTTGKRSSCWRLSSLTPTAPSPPAAGAT